MEAKTQSSRFSLTKVTRRIVEMFSKGQIEASVAMKLLAEGFTLPPALESSTAEDSSNQANKRSQPDSDHEEPIPCKAAKPEP